MTIVELLLIAIGLSMDAFAVAICVGLAMAEASLKKACVVGCYFGGFQTIMPVAGFFVATLFADKIIAYDHFVAFALLCFLGGKMIAGSFKKEGGPGGPGGCEASLGLAKMLPLAIATSIDALAVGVSFAFLRVSIAPAAAVIGAITFVISMLGVKIGNVFGAKFKSKAELAGGIILILIGLKILLEHLYGNAL